MILAYRAKTGCKQYVYKNRKKMYKYFSRKNYYMELIMFQEYDKNGNLKFQGTFNAGKNICNQ